MGINASHKKALITLAKIFQETMESPRVEKEEKNEPSVSKDHDNTRPRVTQKMNKKKESLPRVTPSTKKYTHWIIHLS